MTSDYEVPHKYKFELHHIRPRFKNDVEGVLAFMSDEIMAIGQRPADKFNETLSDAIRRYPGNGDRTQKTIQNWRTEITSLFGLIESSAGDSYPSRLCIRLHHENDWIEFFRQFLFTFQYPGGHLAPKHLAECINVGVRFHPASRILDLLKYGTTGEERFGLTDAEVTHHMFNDLRVTRDHEPTPALFERIQKARQDRCTYDTTGDVVRYAGDILDYLVLADLADRRPNGKYYPKMQHLEVIKSFVERPPLFHGYDSFYDQRAVKVAEITPLKGAWFAFVNQGIDERDFGFDLTKIDPDEERDNDESEPAESNQIRQIIAELLELKKDGHRSTKDIGNAGEQIVLIHERKRIANAGGDRRTINRIKKIPDNLAVGYDVQSYLGRDGDCSTRIMIEVKTTVSKNPLNPIRRVGLTGPEWDAARTHRDNYFIYRIVITQSPLEAKLFVIQNPFEQERRDASGITVSAPKGVEVSWKKNSGAVKRESLLA